MRGQQSPLCLYAFMELLDEIRKLAETHLKDESHFVVEVITNLRQYPKKLLVILDGDKGISIDDCAELSRELSNALDEGNLISDAFVLEVSTPGLDQPLKSKRQYVKNIGRKVKVNLKLKDKTVEGKLTAVHEERIELLLRKLTKHLCWYHLNN
jgi:ribosome maturation factor RimP